MPGLVRKLVILAAVDGLVLKPVAQRNQRETQSLRISYASHKITSQTSFSKEDANIPSIDAHGICPIAGLLSVASSSYLISISRRKQVAQIRGSPIYVVTGVALIPLTSQKDAKNAIAQAKLSLEAESREQTLEASADSDTSEDEDSHLTSPTEPKSPETSAPTTKSSSVAEDVIGKRGQYERETSPSQKAEAASAEKRDTGTANVGDGMSRRIPTQAERSSRDEASNASVTESITNTLLPKLIKTTRVLLASQSFFFSYDYDITRRMGSQGTKSKDVPLHRSVDPIFFWNHHLATPFIAGSHHAYVLPLMQGFVGQRTFSINVAADDAGGVISGAEETFEDVLKTQEESSEPTNFLITLISRRSTSRPGLRYLRRGVDDQGHTANSVETEQILSKASWNNQENLYSFTSIRGSIPLFFSQSPYAFKPVPLLQHSSTVNHDAFRRHFANAIKRYGAMYAVSLVDKTGGEAAIGEQYKMHIQQLNEEGGISGTQIGFQWFDFHTICRGMKFENVKLLVDSLDSSLDRFGYTIERGGKLLAKQVGVVRTNCMDCLDRTNVAQSACASKVLEKQLQHEGVEVDFARDPTTQWFNTLWADNGDAISKQYSSTAALKGDYTRTRKRNYRGAINDLGLTLSRYYNNIVSDFFSQAAIDYLLGNIDASVFDDFEADMMSGDPGISMGKIRANAIETSSKIVIADQHEDLISGWTMLSPQLPNTVRTWPFEEVILLLTDAALYSVRFDWNTEKVSSYERVDLRSVTSIICGIYVTSTLAVSQMDEQKNVGIVIRYKPGQGDVQKRNTRSLSTAVGKDESPAFEKAPASPSYLPTIGIESAVSRISGWNYRSDIKLLAFKALLARSSIASADGQDTQLVSGRELVRTIGESIERAALGVRVELEGEKHPENQGARLVEEQDIISLDEAKRSTGYLEQWSHSLKKFVWA
ncbi:MAG: hypothetical protein Q9191_000631 [Dirinaria sp. TL-2023a]